MLVDTLVFIFMQREDQRNRLKTVTKVYFNVPMVDVSGEDGVVTEIKIVKMEVMRQQKPVVCIEFTAIIDFYLCFCIDVKGFKREAQGFSAPFFLLREAESIFLLSGNFKVTRLT